ncbi:MAG: ABC transporter substrate-binding protein, partial [Rhodospirillales bacterium]|nr:ABC transporter substrate-binding protein [Rhodospirillales bacterium]
MKHRSKLVILTAAGALLAASPSMAQTKGGTLTVGMDRPMTGFDSSMNPRPEYNRRNAMLPVYEDLFSRGKDGKLIPVLGQSMKSSPDKKTWIVTLRKGIRFSNGESFTADTYVVHFKRYQASRAWGFLRGMVGPIKEVVAIDSYTVEFRMLRPFPAFGAILSNPVYPMWANAPKHSQKVGKELNRQPVGTGPYMLANWTPGVSITYVKNPYYWNPKKQHLDKIVFKVIKGELPRLNSVKSGAIDVMLTRDGKTANQAKQAPNLQVITELVGGTTTIEFNTSRPPLNDVRVRKALAHAVNRRADLKASNDGFGLPSTDWFGPGSKWHCGGKTGYPEFNPRKAKGLLMAYGKPVKFKMVTMPIKNFIVGAKLHQTFWKRMGVEVELKVVPPGPAYFRAVRSGKFDAWLVGISEAVDPGLQGQAFYSKNRGNSTKSNFADVDVALEKAWRSFKDEATRKAAYCDYVSAVIKQQPILFRSHNNFALIAGKKVKGLTKPNLTISRLHEAWL